MNTFTALLQYMKWKGYNMQNHLSVAKEGLYLSFYFEKLLTLQTCWTFLKIPVSLLVLSVCIKKKINIIDLF